MSYETFQHLRIRLPKWFTSWVIFLVDLIPAFIAYWFILIPGTVLTGFSTLVYFVLMEAFWGVLFLSMNLYNPEPTSSRFIELQRLVLITFTVLVLLIFFDAINYIAWPINPQITVKFWFTFTFGTLFFRMLFRTFQKYLLRKGIGRNKTVIVGMNSRGLETAAQIEEHGNLGYDIIGFIQAIDDKNPDNIENGIPLLGKENQLKEIILIIKCQM